MTNLTHTSMTHMFYVSGRLFNPNLIPFNSMSIFKKMMGSFDVKLIINCFESETITCYMHWNLLVFGWKPNE